MPTYASAYLVYGVKINAYLDDNCEQFNPVYDKILGNENGIIAPKADAIEKAGLKIIYTNMEFDFQLGIILAHPDGCFETQSDSLEIPEFPDTQKLINIELDIKRILDSFGVSYNKIAWHLACSMG